VATLTNKLVTVSGYTYRRSEATPSSTQLKTRLKSNSDRVADYESAVVVDKITPQRTVSHSDDNYLDLDGAIFQKGVLRRAVGVPFIVPITLKYTDLDDAGASLIAESRIFKSLDPFCILDCWGLLTTPFTSSGSNYECSFTVGRDDFGVDQGQPTRNEILSVVNDLGALQGGLYHAGIDPGGIITGGWGTTGTLFSGTAKPLGVPVAGAANAKATCEVDAAGFPGTGNTTQVLRIMHFGTSSIDTTLAEPLIYGFTVTDKEAEGSYSAAEMITSTLISEWNADATASLLATASADPDSTTKVIFTAAGVYTGSAGLNLALHGARYVYVPDAATVEIEGNAQAFSGGKDGPDANRYVAASMLDKGRDMYSFSRGTFSNVYPGGSEIFAKFTGTSFFNTLTAGEVTLYLKVLLTEHGRIYNTTGLDKLQVVPVSGSTNGSLTVSWTDSNVTRWRYATTKPVGTDLSSWGTAVPSGTTATATLAAGAHRLYAVGVNGSDVKQGRILSGDIYTGS